MTRRSTRTRRSVDDGSLDSSFTFLAMNAQRFEVPKAALPDTGSKRRQRTSLYISNHHHRTSQSSQNRLWVLGSCAGDDLPDKEINTSHSRRSHSHDDSTGSGHRQRSWERVHHHDESSLVGDHEESLTNKCRKYNIVF